MKDGDRIGSTTMTAQTNPTPSSYVLPRRSTLSYKVRAGLIGSKIRRTKQVKVEGRPIFSGRRALSRKLIFCDKLITKTNILRLPDSKAAGSWHQFPPSPSFHSLSSIWWRRRKTLQPTRCNAPIPQIWRHYCDVYTQGGNTLTYIH